MASPTTPAVVATATASNGLLRATGAPGASSTQAERRASASHRAADQPRRSTPAPAALLELVRAARTDSSGAVRTWLDMETSMGMPENLPATVRRGRG